MMNNECYWVGEVVDISSPDVITMELLNSEYHIIKNPFISLKKETDEIIYCAVKTYQNSIDTTRKAVAYHMSTEELETEHPEQVFLIKPYLDIVLLGSIHENKFLNGIQQFNVGLHTRLEYTSKDTMDWLLSNHNALYSLMNQIQGNPMTRSLLKSICFYMIQNSDPLDTKVKLLTVLKMVLREDYLGFKEIADYIQNS